MKKTGLLALVVMLGIVGRGEAADGFYTGSEILSKCKSESVASQDLCKMFLAAVMDTTHAWSNVGELQKMVCMPEDDDAENLKEIFIKYASDKKNKKHLDHAAATLAVNSFIDAYFCNIPDQ